MHFILLLAIAFLHPDSENVFSVQAELQGLYEQALKAPTFDWMTQSIQKLSLWKLHSREQLGRAKVSVAASQYEKYLRDYAVRR